MYLFLYYFFFNDTATTEIYTVSDTLSLHDALPISARRRSPAGPPPIRPRPTTGRCRSEEHTSELQSPDTISYAVFCLKNKKISNLPTLSSYRDNRKTTLTPSTIR